MTRAELITQIEANVKRVLTTDRDKVLVKKVAVETDGTILEEHAIPVRYIADDSGIVVEGRQLIEVVYDENGVDLEADFKNGIIKDGAMIGGNALIFSHLNGLIADPNEDVKDWAASGSYEIGDNKIVGLFTLIANDDSQRKVAATIINNQTVIKDYISI